MRSPYRLNRKKRKAAKIRMKRYDIFNPSVRIRVDVSKFNAAMEDVCRRLKAMGVAAEMTAIVFGKSLREAYARRREAEILYGIPGAEKPRGLLGENSGESDWTPAEIQKAGMLLKAVSDTISDKYGDPATYRVDSGRITFPIEWHASPVVREEVDPKKASDNSGDPAEGAR